MATWLEQEIRKLGLSGEIELGSEQSISSLKVLLVDDTPTNLQVLSHTLSPLGFKLLAANSGESALAIAKRARPQLILLDVMMPGLDGFETCQRLKSDPLTSSAAVIFCSALSDTISKVKGFEMGAVDFITKPYQAEEVIARVTAHLTMQQLASGLRGRNQALEKELQVAISNQKDAFEKLEVALLGKSSSVTLLRAGIAEYAKGNRPVLLYGSSACGEEAVARAMHAGSEKKGSPFIVTDCSEFLTMGGETLIEESDRAGELHPKYKLAAGGTLFLDRLHLLPSRLQEELLDILEGVNKEDEEATRIIAFSGTEGQPLPVDFHPLLAGRFSHSTLHLPALSERREDLREIASTLLERHARRLGKSIHGFEPETLNSIESYKWPGNLRELEDVVVRGALASRGNLVKIDESLLDGSVAIGGYRLIKKIGEGGMGEVWRAKHQLLVRPAAIKLIRSKQDGGTDDTASERFGREARATARLQSPNTVTLYDYGVSEAGDFYYVMELLDGLDLETLVTKHGPLPPGRVARFVVQACRSLAEAHSLSLVHRDIKPANLYICRQGLQVDVLKVLDFGMVGNGEDSGDTRLTREGSVYGTPDYMAPEVAMDSTTVDGKSDIYCLAASAYTALTGKRLFEAGTLLQILMKHVSEKPRPLSDFCDVPEPLGSLVMRCLEKDPSARPSAVELWQELEASPLMSEWTKSEADTWWEKNYPKSVEERHPSLAPTP